MKGVVKRAVPLAGLAVAGGAVAANAITAPSSGSFLYDLYDIVVTKMLQGPAGFVAGVAAIAYGSAMLITGRIAPAVTGILGGALLIKSDAITTSLGLLF